MHTYYAEMTMSLDRQAFFGHFIAIYSRPFTIHKFRLEYKAQCTLDMSI